MRILILGGAGLTGPHQVRYALGRGHSVTLFNRGRTPLPPDLAGVEQLQGDRASGDLNALRGREWDVCIDNPTTLPAWARDASQVLAGHVERYVFLSTISVYADMRRPVAEGDAVRPYAGADPSAETMDSLRASGFELYGPLKALSERWTPASLSGRWPKPCATRWRGSTPCLRSGGRRHAPASRRNARRACCRRGARQAAGRRPDRSPRRWLNPQKEPRQSRRPTQGTP